MFFFMGKCFNKLPFVCSQFVSITLEFVWYIIKYAEELGGEFES